MDAFAALGDPVRRDLVRRLAHGTARVVDLAAQHEISRPAISRHLRVLGEAGLVEADDVGRERHYRLDPSGLAPVAEFLSALTPTSTEDSDHPDRADRLGGSVRFDDSVLDGLDLEVRRTVRDRATTAGPIPTDDTLTSGTSRSTSSRPSPRTTEETA